MNTKKLRLADWAKEHGYTYQGAWNMFKAGLIPNAYKIPSGSIIVEETMQHNIDYVNIIYCRVSNTEQKNNLETQSQSLQNYCYAKGYAIDKIVKEIASGLNDNRKELNKILDSDEKIRLIVEHKDRLTKFGFNYIEKYLASKNSVIEIVNNVEDVEHDN